MTFSDQNIVNEVKNESKMADSSWIWVRISPKVKQIQKFCNRLFQMTQLNFLLPIPFKQGSGICNKTYKLTSPIFVLAYSILIPPLALSEDGII